MSKKKQLASEVTRVRIREVMCEMMQLRHYDYTNGTVIYDDKAKYDELNNLLGELQTKFYQELKSEGRVR